MKKLVVAFAVVSALVVALVSTAYVSAQGSTPGNPMNPAGGYGYGQGGMMGARGVNGTGEGILHDVMIAVFAEKLGISVDDLNARLTNGETISQIAAEKGLTAEEFTALMSDARTQAIDQAVLDGTLTQEQADWMKTRGAGRMAGARGAGRGGMRGMGAGMGNCPYYSQTTP